MESIMKDAPRNLYLSRYVRGKGEESLPQPARLNWRAS
jgi:hypothetical protein